MQSSRSRAPDNDASASRTDVASRTTGDDDVGVGVARSLAGSVSALFIISSSSPFKSYSLCVYTMCIPRTRFGLRRQTRKANAKRFALAPVCQSRATSRRETETEHRASVSVSIQAARALAFTGICCTVVSARELRSLNRKEKEHRTARRIELKMVY